MSKNHILLSSVAVFIAIALLSCSTAERQSADGNEHVAVAATPAVAPRSPEDLQLEAMQREYEANPAAPSDSNRAAAVADMVSALNKIAQQKTGLITGADALGDPGLKPTVSFDASHNQLTFSLDSAGRTIREDLLLKYASRYDFREVWIPTSRSVTTTTAEGVATTSTLPSVDTVVLRVFLYTTNNLSVVRHCVSAGYSLGRYYGDAYGWANGMQITYMGLESEEAFHIMNCYSNVFATLGIPR